MKRAILTLLSTIIFIACLAIVGTRTGRAANIVSAQSGNWGATSTWVGGSIPGAGDDVTIAAGHTVTMDADFSCTALMINAGGTLNNMPAGLTTTGNVTVNGTLTGNGNPFQFNGAATFTNNGSVTAGVVQFNPSIATAQNVAGAGTWNVAILRITSNSTTTMQNAMTFAFNTFTIFNPNGVFNTGGNTLTLDGSTFINSGTLAIGAGTVNFNGSAFNNNSTISGTGLVRLQPTGGTVAFFQGGSDIAPALEVVNGITTVSTFGTGINGTITVDSGAEMKMAAGDGLRGNGNVNINTGATLSGTDANSFFVLNGAALVNNGSIAVANFRFRELGGGVFAQTLSGTGSFSSNTANIRGSDTLTLTSNHQMSAVVIDGSFGGATFDITNRTLGLSGAGTPVTNNGAFITTGSTIIYNGTAAQDAQTINNDWSYTNLTIDDTAGVTLGTAETVPGTLTLTKGVFTVGSNLTMGNGATISRSNGSLSAAPTFGASVNVNYTQTSPVINIATGPEIPIAPTVLNNLTISNSGGVTLSASLTANGTVTVNTGATLTINSPLTLTGNGNATISGTLSGTGTLDFLGATFTNAGSVTVSAVTFKRSGAQTLTGAGSFSNNTATIFSGSTVTLASNHQLSTLVINSGGTINITNQTLMVAADLTATGTFTAGGTSLLNFNGSSNQNWSGAATNNYGAVTVNSTSTVSLGSNVMVSSLTVNGTLQTGTRLVTGAGTFTLSAGATLGIGDPNGITTSGASGNIQVTGTRTYSAGANYIYNGSAAQVTGNGLSQPASVNNLTINNSAGVTLSSGVTVTGALDLTNGSFSIAANTLTINGSLNIGSGSLTGGASSNITVGGAGPSLTLPAIAGGLNNLTINRASGVLLGSSLTVGGTLALLSGALSIGANTLTLNGAITVASGSLTGGGSSNIVIGGSGPSTTLPSVTNGLNNLTINRANGISLGGDVLVNGALTLTSGNVDAGANALAIGASGSISRLSGHVLGNLKKTFSSTGAFTYTVGTVNGFSPVDVTVTAGTGDLTLKAVQGPQPVLNATRSLQRYWTLSGSGITADLTFHYLDGDVMGNESIYRLIRVTGATASIFPANPPTVDQVNNIAFTTGVSSFSDWTAGEPTPPTAVDLVSFAANGYDGGTLLQWQTGYEANNLGFSVYRETSGRRELVNQQLVAGSALVAGSGVVMRAGRSYAWWDKLAKDTQASYWLEDVDINGKSTLHGPFMVKAVGGAPPAHSQAALLSQIGEAQPIITAQATSLPLQKPQSKGASTGQSGYRPSVAAGPAVKLGVREEGWYRVTQSELLAVGLDPKADPRTLQLFLGGVEQALLVTGESDGRLDSTDVVEFYGRGLDTPSSDTHVYWLVSGNQPGKRIKIVASNGKPGGGRSFSYTVERKERSIYFSGLLNGEEGNFFGRVVASQPVEQSLPLQHLDTTSSAAEVEVALQGVTDAAVSGDHQVSVALNGVVIGRMVFDGREHKVERYSVYATLLKEGENRVTLTGQSGGDITLVDYVRVSYDHTYAADSDELKLTASVENGASQTIDNFSTPLIRVMDVSDPASVQELAGQIEPSKGTGFAVTVDVTANEQRTLMAFADGEIKRPASITANQPSSWRSTKNGADMLMITRRDLAAGLEPLCALRESQGLSVAVVDVEDIYDEFNFGEKTPQALRDFIGYAVTTWKKKPRFVLLAGDASFDSRNYLGFGDNDLVPTRLIDTLFMETASDEWLADFDNDGLAEVAMGRLPVRTAGEASKMAAKIVGYERSRPSEEVLLVSDESSGYDFEATSTRLMLLVPANLRVGRIDRGLVEPDGAKKMLMEAINRGQKIVNYAGHGSVDLWSGSLLTGGEARGLENVGHLSLFVMMTCLNGYFQDAAMDSLGEALMKAEGGAVAVWASTGMTAPIDQGTMNEELYRVIFAGSGFKGQSLTMGEAAARAKAKITDGDIRRTWVLLGDPAMKLR